MVSKKKHLDFPGTDIFKEGILSIIKNNKAIVFTPNKFAKIGKSDKTMCCQKCRERRAFIHLLVKTVNWKNTMGNSLVSKIENAHT